MIEEVNPQENLEKVESEQTPVQNEPAKVFTVESMKEKKFCLDLEFTQITYNNFTFL